MDRYDWRAAYERVAPALVTFCILCSMFASVGVYLQGRTNRAQDVARTEDNTAFIKCLDDYTTALAGSLPPVRKASAARDAALSDALGRDGGLAGGFIKAARGDFEEADLKVLIKLLLAYTKADKALTKARAENPYPAPPSKFCALP